MRSLDSQLIQADSLSTTKKSEDQPQKLTLLGMIWQPRNIIFTMVFLQMLWLLGIWLTGAGSNSYKLLVLAVFTLVSGVAVLLLPESIIVRIRQLKSRLIENEKAPVIALGATVLLVGIMYAQLQRVWPWDEELSFHAAQIVAEEGLGSFFSNYSGNVWLGPQHPPLLPILYGFSLKLFGVQLFHARMISVLLLTGAVLVTYGLGRFLYDREVGLYAAIFLATFPLVFRQGAAAMTDTAVMFFFGLAVLLTLFLLRQPNYGFAAVIGMVIGLGMLSKYTMVFIYPVLFGIIVINRSFKKVWFHFGIMLFVSGTMLVTWLAYAYFIGVFEVQSKMVSEFNPGWFVSSSEGQKWLLEFIVTKLTSGLGVYSIPVLIVGLGYSLYHRETANWNLLYWLAIVSILLILSLPDHRYFMSIFPAAAVIMALGLRAVPTVSERIILLALLYCGGALYLFVDWYREASTFIENSINR